MSLRVIFIFILCCILQSCQVKEGKSEGGLIADNVPVENKFVLVKPVSGFYKENAVISLTLKFPFNVTVSGTPQVPVTIGATGAFFNYSSGSGTKNLIFRYTVGAADNDANGISISSPISLNGGTLKFFSDPLVQTDCNLVFSTGSTSAVIVDTTVPTQTTFTTPAAGLYTLGQVISFTQTYSEIVKVTGVPRIELDIGGTTKYAAYVSGTNTNVLTFRYTVLSGDKDLNDIETVSDDINGGTISDRAANSAPFSIAPVSLAGVLVQDVPTRVTSVVLPANGTFIDGELMSFTLNFNRNVTVTGSPQFGLTVGATAKNAVYASGSGSSALTFTYLPADPDLDLNGIGVTAVLDENGGSIVDVAGDDLVLKNFTHSSTSGIFVDAEVPDILSLTPPTNGSYLIGQNMNFIVNFSKAVTLTGTPTLDFVIGSTTVNADYLSGSGTTAVTFRYIPVDGDSDTNGIVLSALSLNGGTIRTSAGNPAVLTLPVTNTSAINVNAVTPLLTGVTAPANATYLVGTNMNFTATFNRAMTVTGTPRISFATTDGTKFANYLSGSGTTTLTFRYTVTAGVYDYNGIVVSSPIDLNGGTIRDTFNYSPSLTFTVPTTTGVLVDASPALITSVSVPASRTYGDGETLNFTAAFTKTVTITGTPRIAITLGASTVYANYQSGSGTASIVFRKVIAAPETDTDGIALASPIQLNGGTIRDTNSINATLTFSVPATAGILVDSGSPFVTTITPPANATYVAGQNLNFILDFNENVTVTGNPRLVLNIGGTTRYANYVSGSGGSTLTFRHSIVTNDVDSDGIGLNATIDLNSGTMADASANAANLALTVPGLTLVRVDAVLPMISSVTLPINGVFTSAGILSFTVNYNKPITVTGTPRIALTIGSTTNYATYFSGSGTTAISYRYTLTASNFDMNGIDLGNSNDIDLNGGTLKDAINTNAPVALGSQNLTGVYVTYPGLGAWFDFNDSSTITTVFASPDYTLSAVTDKSGNAKNITQTVAANRPFHLSSGFGTGNTAYTNFNTAVKFLNIATAVPNVQYVITVVRMPATLAVASYFTSNTTNKVGINATGSLLFNPTAEWKLNGGVLNATTLTTAASVVSASNNFIISAKYASAQTIATQRIGHPTTSPVGGRVSEMLIFTSTAVLTNTELTVIHNYLNAKHGVY